MSPKQRLVVFQPEFIEDLRFWVEPNCKLALKTLELFDVILGCPVYRDWQTGAVKIPGTWSRRLTQEPCIVYLVRDEHRFPASQVPLLITAGTPLIKTLHIELMRFPPLCIFPQKTDQVMTWSVFWGK